MSDPADPAQIARREAAPDGIARLLDLVMQSLPDGIVLLNHSGEPAFTNAQGALVMDAARPYFRDVTVDTRAGDTHADAKEMAAAIAERRASAGEVLLTIAGEQRLHRYEIIPIGHGQYPLLVVVEDIHERRQREIEHANHQRHLEQTARLSALGELVGGVAHELNNPLTAILGFAELLISTDGAEALHEDLGLIHKEALRARNIVRDLLFLVRPGQVEWEEVRPREVVAHIERLRQAAWRKQWITVDVDLCDDEQVVMANEHQLTQVLLNVVTNAEQALADSAAPRLAIRAFFEPGGLVIEVADNGPGMPDDVQERVWEPFYTTKPGTGTGLGLSLARTMVRSHGGTLEFDSEVGRGTTFRVVIPGDVAQPATCEPGEGELASYRRVLVVDDEPSLRKVARRLVESLGHHCDVAGGTVEAMALVRRRDYDLVLCDYRLSSEVADDVLEALAREAPHLVSRVVIATGATTDRGMGELTGRYGLDVLAKPYGVEDISRLLQGREAA